MGLKNDAQITFRLPATAKKELEEAAKRRDRKPNSLARRIILRWLANESRSGSKPQPAPDPR